jgi:crotonobetainyl-CoA:carnitine CoA-transferase CaiB-like acyl-CoA transferase
VAAAAHGPRIVDFSTHWSGPIASHLLAEAGAEIIKIENPFTGDGNRELRPFIGGVGMSHVAFNSGTRSLAINRRSPDWPRVVAACTAWADAVIVGARPKDAASRGLDFASLRRANPRLVYCAVTGFGERGPWQSQVAHGQTVDAFAGLIKLDPNLEAEQPQTAAGWRSSGTTLAGVFAALGILAALYRRDHGVEHAQYVGVSLWHSAMWWSWRDVNSLANTGEPHHEYTDLGTRYSMYWTADRRALLVAPIEKKFWERFCDVADLPAEWRAHGDWGESGLQMEYGRGPEYQQERAGLIAAIGRRSLADWVELLQPAEIPFAPVYNAGEALESEHAEAVGLMREVAVADEPARIVRSPVEIRASDLELEPDPELLPPPELGQHTREILAELGIDLEQPQPASASAS